jgi:hypothetical protein
MNKILKDNLKEVIIVGEVKCYSITEALKEDIRRFKEKLPYGLGNYKGKILCLDIESECDSDDSKFENNDFKDCESLYSNIYKQVSSINTIFDIKVGE